jgi:hypothetical protein
MTSDVSRNKSPSDFAIKRDERSVIEMGDLREIRSAIKSAVA